MRDGRTRLNSIPLSDETSQANGNYSRADTEPALRESEERYRELFENSKNYSRRLIEAQETERRRVSIELHDQVGQILTAVKMNLHSLKQKCTAPEILASIEDNILIIDEAVDQVRDLSVDLRPLLLDDFGLVVALRWYLDRQAGKYGIETEFVSDTLSHDTRFAWELETACFRIVQEAATNVVRHAKAAKISVVLERNESDLMMRISDDGIGFDLKVLRKSVATLGLRGMEERAESLGGSITIDSAPQAGTEISVRIPITNPQGRPYSAAVSAGV